MPIESEIAKSLVGLGKQSRWPIALANCEGPHPAGIMSECCLTNIEEPTNQHSENSNAGLLTHEVLPHFLAFAVLVGATLTIDFALHMLGAGWIGRYLGIPGVLLIAGSFGYSLRKRKLIKLGKPVTLLRVHERMAWAGSLLVLVHAGIHFNALLAWLAVLAMMINIGSGLTGKFLLERSRRRLNKTRQGLRDEGLSEEEVADRLYLDKLTFNAVNQWRAVHLPIALVFAVLAVAHILTILIFWTRV